MRYIEEKFKVVNDINDANVVTHAGTFHADEVMATAILIHYSLTPAGKERFPEGIRLYRATNVQDVDSDILVYDIGGGEFDHHNKDTLQYRQNKIPYAACGLIWRKFGKPIADAWGIDPQVIDKSICEGIDARDNGVNIVSSVRMPGIYTAPVAISTITFSDIVFDMNINYTETKSFAETLSLAETFFCSAVLMASNILDRALRKAEAEASAKQLIAEYIKEATMSDNPDIMIMDIFVPWKPILYNRTDTAAENIKAVIYPSPREGYQWMLVPVMPSSFDTKVQCPKDLRGLGREDLRKAWPQFSDGIFIHPTGFTGAAESIDTCIKMCRYIIDNQEG